MARMHRHQTPRPATDLSLKATVWARPGSAANGERAGVQLMELAALMRGALRYC